MIGTHEVRVSRKRGTSFKFELRRNVTVVRGDSGTGKTTLFEMVADHMRLGDRSGVSVSCDKPCVALTDMDWRGQIARTSDSIVFVDEGLEEMLTPDFARALRDSDNYYVIFCRAELCNLPYSVDEVYRIKKSGKYHAFAPLYRQGEGFRYSQSRAKPKADFDTLLTEDSRSGLQFFESRFGEEGSPRCESAMSNSRVAAWLAGHVGEGVFVIADGAAFGPYADRVLKLQAAMADRVAVCLPESFEWLLLKSGVAGGREVAGVLEDPSSHIESGEYFSWERYFTDSLRAATRGTALAYGKDRLPEAYKAQANADKVMELIACRNVR